MTLIAKSPETIEDVSVPEGHHFHKLLRNWIFATHKYADETKYTDFHWEYGERASIGFVAAAIWLSGGVALEEYWARKEHRDTSTGKKQYTGRCDLYFKLDGKDFIAEAKLSRSRLSHARSIDQIRAVLKSACEDVARLQGQETRLGIVCVSLKLAQSKQNERDELIRQWTEQIGQSDVFQGVSWAYTFPSKAVPIPDRDNWFPGCAVFIRECK